MKFVLITILFLTSVSNSERYKLYNTKNMHNFLKLDTHTGIVIQKQNDGQSFNIVPALTPDNNEDGRYELYETTNMWTFLLLDKIMGKVWQVQFSVKGEDYQSYWAINTEDLRSDKSQSKQFSMNATQNMWTFMLINNDNGELWKLQFSVKSEEYRWIQKM